MKNFIKIMLADCAVLCIILCVYIVSALAIYDTTQNISNKTEVSMTSSKVANKIYNTNEVALRVENVSGGTVAIRTFSTFKQNSSSTYDLYTIEKESGKWKKCMYIRSIDLNKANKKRKLDLNKVKYKYYSEVYYITKLEKGYIYALYPHEKNHHGSKPFWRKPLVSRF